MHSPLPLLPRSRERARRWAMAAAVAWFAMTSGGTAGAQGTPPKPPDGLSTLQGFVIDSIHNTPLVHAMVLVEGTGRNAVTSEDGRYRIDSIPGGPHRVQLLHPILDTLGIPLGGSYTFVAGESHDLDLFVPGGARLAAVLCTPAQRTRGPALMLGFVRDPDTNGPAKGAKVQLVFQVTDIIGRKTPSVREANVDSTGLYRICGLPADMSGKVQVYRNGVSSGEVPTEVTNGLALRAFSIVAKHEAIAEVKNDSGKVTRVAKGSARLTGKVTDKAGRPLADARVMLQGGGTMAVSRSNGDFTLDSLPSGTQAIVVRRLGYAVTEAPVELSSNEPARVVVKMDDFVPTLAVMRIEAAQDKALSDIGYLQRKQTGQGQYMDGKQINHEALAFSDVMRVATGLRIQPLGDGRTYVISDARSASNGCVNYYVDGSPWTTMTPGDIDSYVRPQEIVAVEIYHGSQTPPQFSKPGESSCAAIVVWTVAKVRPKDPKKP